MVKTRKMHNGLIEGIKVSLLYKLYNQGLLSVV